MLDYALTLGMTVEQYWLGDPRLLLNFEEKSKTDKLIKKQEAWLIGAFFKNALESTILVAGLADKDTPSKMPKYPDCPMPTDENGDVIMTDEAIETERERLYRYYHRLAEINNKKGV